MTAVEAMAYCQLVHDLRQCPVVVGSPQTQSQRDQVTRIIHRLTMLGNYSERRSLSDMTSTSSGDARNSLILGEQPQTSPRPASTTPTKIAHTAFTPPTDSATATTSMDTGSSSVSSCTVEEAAPPPGSPSPPDSAHTPLPLPLPSSEGEGISLSHHTRRNVNDEVPIPLSPDGSNCSDGVVAGFSNEVVSSEVDCKPNGSVASVAMDKDDDSIGGNDKADEISEASTIQARPPESIPPSTASSSFLSTLRGTQSGKKSPL